MRSASYIPDKLSEERKAPQMANGQKIPPPPPIPLSPVQSISSGSSGHRSVTKKGFGKLFGRSSDKCSKKSSDGSISHFSNHSVSSFDMGPGLTKADEKRLKKEAAKARTERLAQDLAEKAKKRAEAAKAAKEVHVKEKSKRPWEEGGGLYEGISYF